MSIVMSKEEYLRLQDADEKLRLLEQGGVDNWEFYGEALDGYIPTSELYRDANDFLNELALDAQIDYPAGRDAGHQIIFSDEAIEKLVELMKGEK